MKKSRRRLKARYIVLIVLGGLILAGYLAFATTRASEYTIYIPFSGRVFRIDSAEVKSVRIQNGNTGKVLEYQDSEEIRTITDFLNAFRYRYWMPNPPVARAGWSYRVTVFPDNGEQISWQFSDDAILVRGVWFAGSKDAFNGLTDLFGKPKS